MIVRVFFICTLLSLTLGATGYIFWKQEIQYSLPTPVPANYKAVSTLEKVALRKHLPSAFPGKALFLHFFNPDCPCSRFNSQHFTTLYQQYQDSIQFLAVVPKEAMLEDAQQYLPDEIPIIIDTKDSIATACGVYSSPQAAIISATDQLYYRGNYNKSRYCTQKASNYAEMALQDFLQKKQPLSYGVFADRAYGCSLNEDSGPGVSLPF